MGDGTQTRWGRFVVLEGLDGAGTTTQARLLADTLRARDLRVCLTAEPSHGPVGAICRAHLRRAVTLDPYTAALTFTADRSDHLARVVRPALAQGAWVVCDRYLLSTLAYQGSEGVDFEWIWCLNSRFEAPDLTVLLDVPLATRDGRLAGRASRERYEAPELQEALQASYLACVELLRARGWRVEVVDGSGPPEAVAARVLAAVDGLA